MWAEMILVRAVQVKNIRIAAAGYLRFFLIVKGALRRSFFWILSILRAVFVELNN